MNIGCEQKTFYLLRLLWKTVTWTLVLLVFPVKQLFCFLPLCVFHGENELFAQIWLDVNPAASLITDDRRLKKGRPSRLMLTRWLSACHVTGGVVVIGHCSWAVRLLPLDGGLMMTGNIYLRGSRSSRRAWEGNLPFSSSQFHSGFEGLCTEEPLFWRFSFFLFVKKK